MREPQIGGAIAYVYGRGNWNIEGIKNRYVTGGPNLDPEHKAFYSPKNRVPR